MRVLLMAAVLAAAPIAALAADPVPPAAAAPAAEPSPDALALARQVLEAAGGTRDFAARLHGVLDPIAQATTNSLPAGQQAEHAAVMAMVEKQIEADAPLFIDTAVRVYAQTFTTDELNGLLAFYKTPLGQALLTKQGMLTSEMARANAKLVPTLIRDLLVKICAQTTCPAEVKQRIETLTGV